MNPSGDEDKPDVCHKTGKSCWVCLLAPGSQQVLLISLISMMGTVQVGAALPRLG